MSLMKELEEEYRRLKKMYIEEKLKAEIYSRDLPYEDFAAEWMWSYKHDRPNMVLSGFTPKQRLTMAA